MQQAPQSVRPSNRPGRMTAVMRAVSAQAGPKILRIGVVQAGKVTDERLIKQRTHVTIGPSEKSMFVVPSRKIPANFKLFELIGNDYHLNYLDGMGGRVALKTGISELAALGAQAKVVQDKGVKFNRVRLTDDSRGKVVIGETTFLFQFVVPPPAQPKAQLPISVRKGLSGDIDWFTTIVAAFSFLAHFFFVALIYSDWMDPVVLDQDAVVSQLVESVKSLPPPPVVEKQKAEVAAAATAAATADAAPKKAAGADGGAKAPGKGDKGDAKAKADQKAADLANTLADLDVQSIGALGQGGPALNDVLNSGEVPASMLEAAAGSGAGIGAGDPSGLRGLGGTGRGGTGPLGGGGQGDLSTKGERGGSGDGAATDTGKAKEVKGPTGDASVGGAGVSGGKVANANAVVARMKGRFRACYQAGLNSNPDMAGSVQLCAKIGPGGEVKGVSGGGGSLGPIVGCLRSVVSSAGFAPPDGGSAVVCIPITFVKQ